MNNPSTWAKQRKVALIDEKDDVKRILDLPNSLLQASF